MRRLSREVSLYLCTFVAVALLGGIPVAVQTVRVDATAPVNTIRPREAVGAGIDRIPVEAIDRDLTKQALVPVLESGWQPVTYRRNTELAVEAWHWNPEGTWSGGGGRLLYRVQHVDRLHTSLLWIRIAASRRHAK
jgi:hypothetical protein